MQCLITVGTTEFEELIEEINTNSTLLCSILKSMGIRKLVIQFGQGTLVPDVHAFPKLEIQCEVFRFSPQFEDYIERSHLVISHAGAGTILETLRAGTPRTPATSEWPFSPKRRILYVCVNERLMDNHQTEIAKALSEKKLLSFGTPATFFKDLAYLSKNQSTANSSKAFPLMPYTDTQFSKLLENDLGFNTHSG